MQHSLSLPENKKIILFDGVCNLCNSAVQTIIQHDKKDVFRFVALQSEMGIAIQKHIGVDTRKIDSLVFYAPGFAGCFVQRSSGVFRRDAVFG